MKINCIKEGLAPTYNKIKKRSINSIKVGSDNALDQCRQAKNKYQIYKKQYAGLPTVLGTIGLCIPLPLSSVIFFMIGIGIVKFQKKYIKNKNLNKP